MKPTDPFLVNEPNAFSVLDLVDENNAYHKDVDTSKAMELARAQGLDLVCFSSERDDSNALCKILDYGKWKYKNDKQEKQNRKKNSQKSEVKEIRFSPEISEHDIDHKVKHAKEFIENGHELNFTMRLRRRVHRDLAREKMKEIVQKCSTFANTFNEKVESSFISVRLNKK